MSQAAERLRLEVTKNQEQEYVRHQSEPLGCTRDAHVWCPDRGLGVVEAKAVDWLRHKETWTDNAAPPHIEIQLQAQMLVMGASWGVIACMVGNNDSLLLYERRPIPGVWDQLVREARAFMADVANGNEPPPFGASVELPALAFLYPEVVPKKRVDRLGDVKLGEDVQMYLYATDQKKGFERGADQMKARILEAAGDGEILVVPGAEVFISKSTRGASMIRLPLGVAAPLARLVQAGAGHTLTDVDVDAVRAALAWEEATRKASVLTTIKVNKVDNIPADQAGGTWEV